MAETGSKDNKLKRLGKIGVLAGGKSSERAISLMSGKAVYEALKEAGGDVVLLDASNGFEKDIRSSGVEVAFIALHGRFGEDGVVQKILEEMNVSYTGSGPAASHLALDKIGSREKFREAGILVPKYRVIEESARKISDLDFPLVVKPQFEGSSIGLSIVDREAELDRAMDEAFKYGNKLVVEEFIKGRELTVGILDNQALPPVEIVPVGRHYDFFAKYESRDTKYLVPALLEPECSKEIQRLGLLAHKTLGCRSFSRVDMILGNDGQVYVLEVNSIPGLTERSLLPKAAQSAGISFRELCVKILEGVSKREL